MGVGTKGVSHSFLQQLAGYTFEKPGAAADAAPAPPAARGGSSSRSSSRSPSPKRKKSKKRKDKRGAGSGSESPETLRQAILARMAKKSARPRSPSDSD